MLMDSLLCGNGNKNNDRSRVMGLSFMCNIFYPLPWNIVHGQIYGNTSLALTIMDLSVLKFWMMNAKYSQKNEGFIWKFTH